MDTSSARTRLPIRILVANSHQIHDELLASALRRCDGYAVCTARAEMSECLREVQAVPTDVVILDATSDREQAATFALLRGLHDAYPSTRFILLTNETGRDFVINAVRCGANALFDSIRQSFKELCICIDRVLDGQYWLNKEQVTLLVEAFRHEPPIHIVNTMGDALLTAREEQVVRLVAVGLTNREVAQELGVSENTVKKSVLRIFDKLGVSNRVELVLYALSTPVSAKPARGVALQPSTRERAS